LFQPLIALVVASMPANAVEIPFEEYDLDNGLHVILHHDPTLPQVVVNLWYGVGSKDEVVGRSGFAHLFEHLMFMGTTRLPGSGFDDVMERHGGWNNAWTSEDATDYYSVGPSNLLQTLIWLEADRMDGLAGAMTQEKLDLQRDVVRNERRQSVEETPYGVVWDAMPGALYPDGHPYAHSVIGSHEDLEAATLDDVIGFFDAWYVPQNASLVIAGDFDAEQVRSWIDGYFGHLPATPVPERPAVPAVDRPEQAVVELSDDVEIPMTLMMWHTPEALAEGDAAFDFVASILGEGRSSRLYQRLIHTDQSALEADAAQYSQLLSSLFMVSAKPSEGHTIEEIEVALSEELARLAADGPTAEEMDRVRNAMQVDFLERLEPLRARASSLNRYRYLTGDAGYVQQDVDRYTALTAADVQAAAATLTESRRCLIRVWPDDAESDESAEDQGEE